MKLIEYLEALIDINKNVEHIYLTNLYDTVIRVKTDFENLYNDVYMSLYSRCKEYDYTKYFQETGLKLHIFKYGDESPYSRFYYELNNKTINNIDDVYSFYDYICEDSKNISIMDDLIYSRWFINTYNYNGENENPYYNYSVQFQNEFTLCIEKLVIDLDDIFHDIKYKFANNELIDCCTIPTIKFNLNLNDLNIKSSSNPIAGLTANTKNRWKSKLKPAKTADELVDEFIASVKDKWKDN